MDYCSLEKLGIKDEDIMFTLTTHLRKNITNVKKAYVGRCHA